MDLTQKIRVIEDFPKKGISFKDITTLLKDREAYHYTVDTMVNICREMGADVVVGPEARGFVLGAPVAYGLGTGFIPGFANLESSPVRRSVMNTHWNMEQIPWKFTGCLQPGQKQSL